MHPDFLAQVAGTGQSHPGPWKTTITRNRHNDKEMQNLAGKNKPIYTKDNKNTKADHTTEPQKSNRTAPMRKLVAGKNDIQETPNDTPPLGAIP